KAASIRIFLVLVIATLECKATQEIPREDPTTVESLEEHGFTIKWARGGVRVRATSLDGHGVFEGSELIVTKRKVRWSDADAAASRSTDIVRREQTSEGDYVFELSDDEMM